MLLICAYPAFLCGNLNEKTLYKEYYNSLIYFGGWALRERSAIFL